MCIGDHFSEFHVRAFLDESGQMESPGQKALGIIFLPVPLNDESNLKLLSSVVAPLRERIRSAHPSQKSPKGAQWCAEDVSRLAKVVRRERWVIGLQTLDTRPAKWREEWEGEKAERLLRDGLEKFKDSHGPRHGETDELLQLFMTHPAYVNSLCSAIRDFGEFMLYQKKHWILSLQLTIDARFNESLYESIRRMVCIGFMTTFKQLAADAFTPKEEPRLVNLIPSNASVSDGMVIADALAYWNGQISRGRDPDGIFQGYLDALNIRKPLPSAPA